MHNAMFHVDTSPGGRSFAAMGFSVLRRLDWLAIRDPRSYNTLLDLGVSRPRMTLTQDMSFLVPTSTPRRTAVARLPGAYPRLKPHPACPKPDLSANSASKTPTPITKAFLLTRVFRVPPPPLLSRDQGSDHPQVQQGVRWSRT